MLRPLVKLHGGKWYLCRWILSHFPTDSVELAYLEPFAGAASVLMNKERSAVSEWWNDRDMGLANLFYCLRHYPDPFSQLISETPYSKKQFVESRENCRAPKEFGDLGCALHELVTRRMSRGGMKKAFSWSKRLRGKRPGDENAWITWRQTLPQLIERMHDVQVTCLDGRELIEQQDHPDLLIYADPPYLPSTRRSPAVYDVEMTEKEHVELAYTLRQAKSKVILSGYHSDLYQKMYKGWRMEVQRMPNHASQADKKEHRIECVWMNY